MEAQMKAMAAVAVVFLLAAGALAADGPGVAVTVYNSNLGLVKDVRAVSIPEGISELRFPGVAERIEPTSVHFAVLEGPEAAVWEQNYRFDLASSSKILEKYLTRDIDVVTEDADLFSGRLVSVDGSAIVLDQGRGTGPVVTLNRDKVSYIRFPALPAGLISKPSLVWKVGAERGGERLVEVSYLTSGITWHAEYVGVINAEDDVIDLAAWVSIDNRSGATYEDAQLDLVAGDIHRATQYAGAKGMAEEVELARVMAPAPEFAEEALFEYYLYKLDTPATVADREIKQLTFFPSTPVAVEKVFEFDPWNGTDVRVLLEFENSEEAGLGRALPAGVVRMYKMDSAEDMQFLGEDRIDHTPKDEDVSLFIGAAFDVKAERTTVATRKITDRVREEDYEISLRNHKDEDVIIRVVDHPRSYWSVTRSSHEYEKVEAYRIEFQVPVPADGETTVAYTIRYEY
jgi:hypothetical protein